MKFAFLVFFQKQIEISLKDNESENGSNDNKRFYRIDLAKRQVIF